MVLGIIALFVGVSVLPSISGNVDTKNEVFIQDSKASSTTDWWPMFHHDLKNSGYSTSVAPNTNNVKWTYHKDSSLSFPSIADGKVYIGSIDDNVYCVSARTGILLWNYSTDGSIDWCPAIKDDRIYVGSRNGTLYCLAKDAGQLIWSFIIGQGPLSSPSIADGNVYIGSSYDYKLYCLDSDLGNPIWNYTTTCPISFPPAISNGKVYFGSNDIYCLNAITGNYIWSYPTNNIYYSSPAVINDKLYIGTSNDKLLCLDANTGDSIWNYTAGEQFSSPGIGFGNVYIGSWDNNIYCLDANTGNCIWNYTTGNRIVFSSPAVADGKIYIGSEDGYVYCLNAYNGTLVWRYKAESIIDSSPAISEGEVYISSSQTLYCFGENEPLPDLDCSGTLSWTQVPAGSTQTGSFIVKNSGEPLSLLEWEIESYPDWGSWNFTPDSGTNLTPEAGPVTINVEVVAPNQQVETFSGNITVENLEDSSDFEIIDVTLITPTIQAHSVSIILKIRRFFLSLIPSF